MSQPFPPTALRRSHTQTIRDSTSSYKIDYVIVIKNFVNPKRHQNPISGSKVTAILMKRYIFPIANCLLPIAKSIGEVALERVCACSLRSRLVYLADNMIGPRARRASKPPVSVDLRSDWAELRRPNKSTVSVKTSLLRRLQAQTLPR